MDKKDLGDIVNEKEPNKFVKGFKSLYNNYLDVSSDTIKDMPIEELAKLYDVNTRIAMIAFGGAVAFPIVSLPSIWIGGKAIYNISRARPRYMEEIMHAKPNKKSKLYNLGKELYRFTEGSC